MAGRIVFVVGDDVVFTRYCLPAARAAVELGFVVSLVTHMTRSRSAIPIDDLQVVAMPAGAGLSPARAGYAAGQTAQALKAVGPDLAVCLGLRSALVGGAACVIAGVERRVFVSPGVAGRDRMSRLANRVARAALGRAPLRSAGTRIVFGSIAERDAFAPGAEDGSLLIVDDVGVDGARLRPNQFPPASPLRVALVSPLIDTDEVELAVQATRLARARGNPVEMSLFRAPMPTCWGALSDKRLEAFAAANAVAWGGPVGDLQSVWRNHHAVVVPSPDGTDCLRTVVEAAACGRPAVANDSASCRRFVRDGREGVLVSGPGPEAFADAFARFLRDPVLLPRMGAAARARALDGFAERDGIERWKDVFAGLLADTR